MSDLSDRIKSLQSMSLREFESSHRCLQRLFLTVLTSNGNCHESDGSISYPGSADFKNYRAGTNNNEGQVISSFLVVAN